MIKSDSLHTKHSGAQKFTKLDKTKTELDMYTLKASRQLVLGYVSLHSLRDLTSYNAKYQFSLSGE